MNLVYARENLGTKWWYNPSIFLAGPTCRHGEHDCSSWRPEALNAINHTGFEGNVFIPEDRGGGFDEGNYDTQVEWEWSHLDNATVVMFWVPRNLETLPGFTTNVEFGMYVASGKITFGAPPDAEKITYLKRLCQRHSIPVYSTLRSLCMASVAKAVSEA